MDLWLNPVGGVSGDMLLAALVDAGAPVDGIRAAIASTGLTGWWLEVERSRTNAIPAAVVRVHVDDSASERRARELRELVGRALPAPAAKLASRAIASIAEVEARLHGEPVDEVHLHEIGGLDTVVDLLGVGAALDLLGVQEVFCGPLPLGTGTVRTRHGVLPAPAPATLELLKGMPVAHVAVDAETVTPTGAALLRAMGCRFDSGRRGVLRAAGYGAGIRQSPDRPNLLVAMLCEPMQDGPDTPDSMTLIETTVDDVTGEELGYTIQALIDLGAADAWAQPATGKKGRPIHIVTVLSPHELADALELRLLAETGSLGARRTRVTRTALSRHVDTIEVDGNTVRVKRGPHGYKPEFDDIAAIAKAKGTPWRLVARRAMDQYARMVEKVPGLTESNSSSFRMVNRSRADAEEDQ